MLVMRRLSVIVSLSLLIVGWSSSSLRAQSVRPSGTGNRARPQNDRLVHLTGEVLDPQRRPIPGARMDIARRPDGFSQTVFTDQRGWFTFPRLSPGVYEITVKARGFAVSHLVREIKPPTEHLVIQLEIEPIVQEIEVTATFPELAPGLTVKGRQFEEQNAYDVAGFLRRQPGLSAFRRGPVNLEPTVRGLQENEIGMFVDGTRTFAAGPARMDSDISHVSPHAVQTVRVIKGPYALTWGAGTLSALQVETFRPPFSSHGLQVHGRAGFHYGENAATRDGYGLLWAGTKRLRLHLFYNARLGNDYRAGNDQLVPGDFESHDVQWSLGWRPSTNTLIQYIGGYQEQHDIDYPGRILDATYFFTRSQNWEFVWTPSGHPISEIGGQFYFNFKDHLMNNDEKPTARPLPGRRPPFGIRVDLPTESNTLGGNAHVTLNVGRWNAKLGFDFYNADQTAMRSIFRRDTNQLLFQDIVWPAANINDQGTYARLLYRGERVQTGAALRVDWVQSSAGRVSEFFRTHVTGPLNRRETNVSAALQVRLSLHERWSLSMGIGRSVRTATALERYSDRFPSTKFQIAAEFMGNPALDPEKGLEIDIGQVIRVGGFLIEADAFYRRIDAYITIQPDPSLPKRLPLSPPVVFRYINGTGAQFYGGEVRARRALGSLIEWRGSLSSVWAEDESLDEPLIGIPPLRGQLGVNIHSPDGRFWADLHATMVDAQTRVAVSRFERPTPGYVVFDLRGGAQLFRHWTLHVGLENMGDRFFVDHLNAVNPFTKERIPEPGRNVYVGLELSF